MTTTERLDQLLTFDRTDFLGTRALLWLLAVGTPLVTLVLPAVDWVRGEPLTWELLTSDATVPVSAGVETYDATVGVAVADAGTGAWVATLVPGLLLTIAVATGAWLLLRLLGTIQRGEPFVAASVRSLRGIAALLMVTPLVGAVADSVADRLLADRALAGPTTVLGLELGGVVWAWLAGLVLAAVAEAFARGVRIEQDLEGLV